MKPWGIHTLHIISHHLLLKITWRGTVELSNLKNLIRLNRNIWRECWLSGSRKNLVIISHPIWRRIKGWLAWNLILSIRSLRAVSTKKVRNLFRQISPIKTWLLMAFLSKRSPLMLLSATNSTQTRNTQKTKTSQIKWKHNTRNQKSTW